MTCEQHNHIGHGQWLCPTDQPVAPITDEQIEAAVNELNARREQPRTRSCYLLRHKLIALDLACVPLAKAFHWSVYLVGSCMERADYRDVDVRAILDDDEFAAMFPGVRAPTHPFHDARWEMLCLTMSEHLSRVTGLPIDFQYQQMTAANAEEAGPRNPLGTRVIDDQREGLGER